MFLTINDRVFRNCFIYMVCRNPLKSGQCFLLSKNISKFEKQLKEESQSPQIGSMFLTLEGILKEKSLI